MTGLNHALTGALVAAAIDEPAIALPAALLSHFVIDMIPHWDYRLPEVLKPLAVMMDFTLSLSLLLILAVTVDASPRMIIAGGILGILPDAMWLPGIVVGKEVPKSGKSVLHRVRRIHSKLQWSETRSGLIVEIIWLPLMIILLYNL